MRVLRCLFLLLWLAGCTPSQPNACISFPIDPCGISFYGVNQDLSSGCVAVMWSIEYGVQPYNVALIDDPDLTDELFALFAANDFYPFIYPCD